MLWGSGDNELKATLQKREFGASDLLTKDKSARTEMQPESSLSHLEGNLRSRRSNREGRGGAKCDGGGRQAGEMLWTRRGPADDTEASVTKLPSAAAAGPETLAV